MVCSQSRCSAKISSTPNAAKPPSLLLPTVRYIIPSHSLILPPHQLPQGLHNQTLTARSNAPVVEAAKSRSTNRVQTPSDLILGRSQSRGYALMIWSETSPLEVWGVLPQFERGFELGERREGKVDFWCEIRERVT